MTGGLITAPQPEVVEAGADVLRDGGNAVDAAVATALVQTAVDPIMCGIAGFGSMQVYMPGQGGHRFIDFHGRAPAAARAPRNGRPPQMPLGSTAAGGPLCGPEGPGYGRTPTRVATRKALVTDDRWRRSPRASSASGPLKNDGVSFRSAAPVWQGATREQTGGL